MTEFTDKQINTSSGRIVLSGWFAPPIVMHRMPITIVGDDIHHAIVLREGTPSFRTVGNHAGLFWFSMYRFNVSTGAPPAVPA